MTEGDRARRVRHPVPGQAGNAPAGAVRVHGSALGEGAVSAPEAAFARRAPSTPGVNFPKLFGSGALSNLGDGLLMAAGPLLAYSLTKDPLLVGLASFFQSVP